MSDTLETIQAYLDGTLPESGRRLFEEKMTNDPGLAETFRLYKGIHAAMNAPAATKGEDQLRETLHHVRNKHIAARRPHAAGRPVFRAWRVAAILLLAAGIGIAWWWLRQPDAAELYAKYGRHEDIEAGLRGSANDRLAITAARAYNAGNYDRAAILLKRYNMREPGVVDMQLAEGVCYLELNRFAEAVPVFDSIAQGQTALASHGQWYLGLLYLKQQKLDEAKKKLRSIAAGSAMYDRAQSLLKEIP